VVKIQSKIPKVFDGDFARAGKTSNEEMSFSMIYEAHNLTPLKMFARLRE